MGRAIHYKSISGGYQTCSMRSVYPFGKGGYVSVFLLMFFSYGLSMGVIFNLIYIFLIYANITFENFIYAFLRYGLWIFVLSGFLFGLPMAYYLQDVEVTCCPSEVDTINTIRRNLERLNYHLSEKSYGYEVYKSSLTNGLVAGEITLWLNDKNIILRGPYRFLLKMGHAMDWKCVRQRGI